MPQSQSNRTMQEEIINRLSAPLTKDAPIKAKGFEKPSQLQYVIGIYLFMCH